MVTDRINALMRRIVRSRLRRESRGTNVATTAGRSRLRGYGLEMAYPNRLVWLHQFLEVFDQDRYGVRALPPQARVVDVGANIGLLALYVMWRHPLARVVAVEPGAENLRYLRANVGHRADGRVEVRPVAVARARGSVVLGGSVSDALRIGATQGEPVEAIPLSDLLTEPTDLLKMNIEGAEVEAVAGAGSGMRLVRRAVIECHEYRDGRRPLASLIRSLQDEGFDRFRVVGHQEYDWEDPALPVHTCLLESWRSARGHGEQTVTPGRCEG